MAEIVDISSTVRNYKDLKVWQQGVELTKRIYRLTQTLPKEELYGLTSQMRRAAVSVPSNIAEGHVRQSLKEYIRHLSIATASLAELETQLILCEELDYVETSRTEDLHELIEKTLKMLRTLSAKLKEKL
ncbi:MAG: four helix bundle protein [Caldilineaceae bacterium]|nr:four helix bundle protein [Caldilineaceae bacterium]